MSTRILLISKGQGYSFACNHVRNIIPSGRSNGPLSELKDVKNALALALQILSEQGVSKNLLYYYHPQPISVSWLGTRLILTYLG